MKSKNINHGIDFYMHDDVSIRCLDTAQFGNHVAIDKGFYCTTELSVGSYVHIGPYVSIIGSPQSKMIMQDFSFISVGTKVIAGSDDYSASCLMGPLVPKKYKTLILTTIKFEKYSGCGASCTILPGVTLAEGSVVCAGSLVNKSTKPWTIYAGNPARPIGTRDSEKVRLQEKYILEENNEK